MKLNLGCGVTLLTGFTNVDIHYKFRKKNYVRADVRKLPFEDGSCDYILARQVIEHIPIKDIIPTLAEWVRVLKKGGRMVVTAPNFDDFAREWASREFDPETYYEMAFGIYGNQLTPYEKHLTPITPKFLEFCLRGIPVQGKIKAFPKYSPMEKYPGYGEDGKVYRYGEVHLDLTKI